MGMKALFNQHFWKFLVGFFTIMAAGFFFLVWANDYHIGSEQKSGEQYLKDLKRAYDEDTYGGKTPEETLSLFIDALKKGDTDLASKYFVPEKQEEWKENLEKVKERNQLNSMINDLTNAERGKDLSSETSRFVVANSSNEVITVFNISKIPNGVWKILDL